MQNIKDSKVSSSDAAVNTQLWRLNHDSMTWQDVTLENIETTSGVAVESKKEVTISNLQWKGTNIFRKTILNLVGDQVVVKDSALVELQIDPTQSEVLFQSKAHVFDGSSFSLEGTTMTNIKDLDLIDEENKAPETQISQLWKVEHDSVKLDQLTIKTIEVASGIMVVSKSSLVCSEVTIDNAGVENEFRKGILDMKSNNAVVKNSVIQNIKIDPVGQEQILSFVGETIGDSSLELESVQIMSIEDVKLASSTDEVNTHLLKAESN